MSCLPERELIDVLDPQADNLTKAEKVSEFRNGTVTPPIFSHRTAHALKTGLGLSLVYHFYVQKVSTHKTIQSHNMQLLPLV